MKEDSLAKPINVFNSTDSPNPFLKDSVEETRTKQARMTEEELCKKYLVHSKELQSLIAQKENVKHGPTIPLSDFNILKEKIREIHELRKGYFQEFLKLPAIAPLWARKEEFDPKKIVVTIEELIKKHTGEDLHSVFENPKSLEQSSVTDREKQALDLILQYGGIDGAHHKQWILDQVVRILTGENYGEWVREHNKGEDGPDTYEWDEGIAP